MSTSYYQVVDGHGNELTTTRRVYELWADDIMVWSHAFRAPTQDDIDHAARGASERGWNGTTLDLFADSVWSCFCYPRGL